MTKNTKEKLYEIIFEADTKKGKAFDIILLIVILVSILGVMLESVKSIGSQYPIFFNSLEWIITIIFTIEYIVRTLVVKKSVKYIYSFYGVVDLLSVIPAYIGLFAVGASGLVVIRALRLLRVFRILKLTRYTHEAKAIMNALKGSWPKISVFISAVLMVVIIIGTVMYLVEGEEHGFKDIPTSIYWAIVTLTTVGYGDISPHTPFGELIASFVMLLGYAIIAVPTGIVSFEFVNKKKEITTQVCPLCLEEGHDTDAEFCKYCGEKLN